MRFKHKDIPNTFWIEIDEDNHAVVMGGENSFMGEFQFEHGPFSTREELIDELLYSYSSPPVCPACGERHTPTGAH